MPILPRFFAAKFARFFAAAAFVAAPIALSPIALGELIPAARLTDWTPGVRTGVIGGIPASSTRGAAAGKRTIDVTQAPYSADNTGATDARGAIQSAIDSAGAGDVVYLPAGTYRINYSLFLGTNFSGKTLRGAGPDVTFIDSHANVGLEVGSSSGAAPAATTPLLVTGGLSKRSTTVTVNGSTASLSVGQVILFNVQNDESIPVVSVYNYDVQTDQAPTNQAVRIVSKANNSLTFFPPLHDAYGGGNLEVRVQRWVYQANSIGVEDLTIDAANFGAAGAYSCLRFNNCLNSWAKNCNLLHAGNYPFSLNGLNCEVRHCTIRGLANTGSNGAALLFSGHSCLVEDNVILDGFPIIEVNGGASGNVFAYNYGPPTGLFDTNHAPHNQFNLYEGNALGYQMSDGYFGSEANLTLFRNYFHGSYGVNLRRFTRSTSVLGNMLPSRIGDDGFPNIGNTFSDGTAKLSTGNAWRDWHMMGTLTSRTDDATGEITLASGALFGGKIQVIRLVWGENRDQQRFAFVNSVSGNVAQIVNYSGGTALPSTGATIYIGPGAFSSSPVGSYQERDLDVAATLVKKGNRYADSNDFDSLGGDSLPDSLFRSGKPSWWSDRPWPPFDPVTPTSPSVENIPAGYRYVHGVDPPAAAAIPPQPPAGLTAASPSPVAASSLAVPKDQKSKSKPRAAKKSEGK